MGIKVAINGFGRIGRNLVRSAVDNPAIEILAINDLTDPKTLAHLLKYDSVQGIFNAKIDVQDNYIILNGKRIRVLAEKDPQALPWKELGIQIALESTGKFVTRDGAQRHINAGAGRVIISAPATDPDITLAIGVNEGDFNPAKDRIISNASCTTNCLAPIAKVINDNFGIKRGFMTTIHSYTNDQRLLDLPHKDLRRARAAALSMIPTSTGAAKAVGLVLPALKGRLDAIAIRVPTPNVSLIDLVVELEHDATSKEINEAVKKAANSTLKGVVEYSEEPLVSIDMNGNPHSAIFDSSLTMMLEKRMVKVIAWYDNEWGYANRIYDLIRYIGKRDGII
ncbi:MAG TPA: type I glyceraldehyde-3-phosphate dehydrogenase [Nitrospiria bacterium]|nr:type I glyceraldehyde-3-phosphate dehydrogenase [Nitrospiria bacterium]